MNTCGRCGTAYTPGTRTCGSCGAAVVQAMPDFFAPAPAAANDPPPYPPASMPLLAAPSGLSAGLLAAVVAVVVLLASVIVVFAASHHDKDSTHATRPVTPISAATRTGLEGALRAAATAEETFFVDHNTYTKNMGELRGAGFAESATADVTVLTASTNDYCLLAAGAGTSQRLFYSRSGGTSQTPCGSR